MVLLDAHTFALAYATKTYRIAALWFVAYLMEKVYLARYLTRVFIEDARPAGLFSLAFVILALEFMLFCGVMLAMYLFASKFKGETNAFVIDGEIIRALWIDYALSTAVLLVVGAALATVVQNCALFHYRHEGMRGIRAYSELFVQIAIVVILLPYFPISGTRA